MAAADNSTFVAIKKTYVKLKFLFLLFKQIKLFLLHFFHSIIYDKCQNWVSQYFLRVGVNCSNCDCSTRDCSTLLAGNQLLDTNFDNCLNPVNPG